MKLQIGRREFSVELISNDADMGRAIYRLTGPRGAVYATMRNASTPHLMFLVHAPGQRGFGIVQAYETVRLTDESGTLAVRSSR